MRTSPARDCALPCAERFVLSSPPHASSTAPAPAAPPRASRVRRDTRDRRAPAAERIGALYRSARRSGPVKSPDAAAPDPFFALSADVLAVAGDAVGRIGEHGVVPRAAPHDVVAAPD